MPQQLQVRNPKGLKLTWGRSCLLTKPVMWILSHPSVPNPATDWWICLLKVSTSLSILWHGPEPGERWDPSLDVVLFWLWIVLPLCVFQGLWVNGISFFNFLPFSPSHRSHFRAVWKLLPFADLTFQLLTWTAPKPGCTHGSLGASHPQALPLSGEMLLEVLCHWLYIMQEALPLPSPQIKTETVKWRCLNLHGKLSLSSAK